MGCFQKTPLEVILWSAFLCCASSPTTVSQLCKSSDGGFSSTVKGGSALANDALQTSIADREDPEAWQGCWNPSSKEPSLRTNFPMSEGSLAPAKARPSLKARARPLRFATAEFRSGVQEIAGLTSQRRLGKIYALAKPCLQQRERKASHFFPSQLNISNLETWDRKRQGITSGKRSARCVFHHFRCFCTRNEEPSKLRRQREGIFLTENSEN